MERNFTNLAENQSAAKTTNRRHVSCLGRHPWAMLFALMLFVGMGTAWGQNTTQGPDDCIKVTYVQGNGTPTVTYYQRLTGTGVGALNAVGGETAGTAANRKVFTIELLWSDDQVTDQYTLDNMTTYNKNYKDIIIKTAEGSSFVATIKRGNYGAAQGMFAQTITASGTLTFENIILDGMDISSSYAGAILSVASSTVTIGTGTILQNGNTSGNGGLVNVSGGTLNINGATLQNGNATNGAIINKAGTGELIITGTEINGGSTASTLINITAGATTMTNAIINGQSATGTLISNSGTGAMTFTDCAINGSTTAASNTLVSKSSTGAVTFTNTTITRNQSRGYGFINTSTGTVTFDGCTIDGSNYTAATASLIKTNTGVLSLTNTTVTGHTVSAANICAVDASSANGAADTKIYTGTKIIGNTSHNRPANLKISGINYMYIYDPLTHDIGISNQRNNHNNAQFGYSNPTTSIGVEHLINDLTDMLTATQSNHALKWVMDPSADPLDDMFGFPNVSITDLVTEPSASDLSVVPSSAIPGTNNADPTNPYAVWKSVTYNDDNSVDITLNYFQKQVGLKLDLIFVIDETGTMNENKTANGYTMKQSLWARRAALEASKGVLQLNTTYAENGAANRIRYISFGGSTVKDGGFMNNYEEAAAYIDSYDAIGGSTNHSVGINAATAACNQSRADGHTPIVVYLSDYQAHFAQGTETTGATIDFFKPSEMNALKAAADAIYALLVYETYTTTIANRMSLMTPLHYYMPDKSDPSTLITPFIDIIHDAVSRCGNGIVVEDGLANGLIPAAAANGVTSSDGTGSYGPTNAVINDNGVETWQLLHDVGEDQDNRLYTGHMYAKVINIPMTDDVYSGAMATNAGLTVKDDGVEVNRIDDSPILGKPLTLVLKGSNASGAPLSGATFTLTRDGNTWNLTTDADGKVVLPWGENDVVGASTATSTFAFNPSDTYTLTQLATINGYVRPGGSWTLSVGSDFKVTPTTTQGAGTVNRTLDMVAVGGKFEIYNDTEPTVIYVANGGDGTPIEVPIDFANDETSHAYTTLTAEASGFTFGDRTLTEWNTEGDGSGTSYALGANVTLSRGEHEDIELFAQWSGEPIIARVSNDGGDTWTLFSYLINTNREDPEPGAFNYANTLSGDVIIETLYEHHNRYTLTAPFTFDKEEITSLTLRTTQDDSWNPETADGRFTSTIYRGVTSSESLITFNIYSNSNPTITIEKITFDGGYDAGEGHSCGDSGGLIYAVHVNLDINDVTFKNTRADYYGGAIYATDYDTHVSFYGTVAFIDCSAGSGGGFYGDATIHGPISFTNCSANYDGGGIYGGVSCESSVTFTNCTAGEYGGGIYIGDSNGPFYFSGPTTFTGCTADQDGGGIYINYSPGESEVIFSNVVAFTNCTAGQNGGGIGTPNDVKVIFTNTENDPDITATFKGCTAADYGGGIKAYNIELGENAQLLLGGGDDESCSANNNYGGGVYCFGTFDASAGNVTITATNCTAGEGGGGICVEYNFTLDGNATFTDCEADKYGGGVYCGGTFDASAAITATNCAAANGGGIYSGDALTIGGNATFTGCTATENGDGGGGIYARDFILNGNATFTNCQADNDGGGIYASGFTLNGNATFTTCQAENGGGIYADYITMNDNASLTMGGTETGQGCMAENKGGGICCSYFDAMANDIQILMTNCTTIYADGGGGIYAENKVEINGDNCIAEFKDCIAGTNPLSRPEPYGGGIFGKEVNLNGDISFDGCQSGQAGGAIAGETISLDGNIEITDCYAKVDGGGIYASGDANLAGIISITGCSADDFGGGIYASGATNLAGNISITDCSAGTNGGGIYLTSAASLTVSDKIIVEDNTHGTGDNTVADDVYLNETNYKYITIGDDGLLCGSHIGVYKVEIEYYCEFESDNNNIPYTDIVQGANANCLFAFHNGFFFDDNNLYGVYYMGNYDPYAEGTIYFIENWEGQASTAEAGTDYVLSSDYVTEVKTAKGLAYFAKDVNSGKNYYGKTVILSNDIDLSDYYWVPIGIMGSGSCSGTSDKPFSGTFDGQGHIISNLKSILPYKAMGLFGFVQSGTITNTFIESGELVGTYNTNELVADDAACVGGLVGIMTSGELKYNEAMVNLTSLYANSYIGGLLGFGITSVDIHSNMAIPEMSNNASCKMGGIVGYLNSGFVENCMANIKFNSLTSPYTIGGVVAEVHEVGIYNSYVRLRDDVPTPTSNDVFGWLAGEAEEFGVEHSYIPNGYTNVVGYTEEEIHDYGTFTPAVKVDGKYGYGQRDLQMTIENITEEITADDIAEYNNTVEGGLTAILNSWVDDTESNHYNTGYARWTRTMASSINDDYPVLMMPSFDGTHENVCLGSKDGMFITYNTDLNNEIQKYNAATGGGNIYLYATNPTEIADANDTDPDVRVFINENVGILQEEGNTLNARVGVTFDNSSTGFMAYDWHMFSTSLSDASLGINYGTPAAGVGFGHQIADGDITLTKYGYYPTNTPFASFDFYAYDEPSRHYINLKRYTGNHWHQATQEPIEYTNEENLLKGKGYLMAIDKETMLMADGVLNNGDVTNEELKYNPSTDEGDNKQTGVNLIGNPYQSYLDFNEFLNYSDNSGKILDNAYYILDADKGAYIAYANDGSSNPEYAPQYIHPHQGFFVAVGSATTLTFTNDMRLATGNDYSNFRGEHIDYPLVNLICTDSDGKRDFTTVEINRPELGGARKMHKMHTGNASLYAHFNNKSYQALFAPEGVREVPVRLDVFEDGVFTMTWSMLHGDFNYVHLIDNLTGANIDLTTNDSYRFEASTDDYASRFRLVFDVTGIEEYDDDQDGPSTGSGSFAFFDGNAWVVNGEGTLQLFDVNGRCLMSTNAEGTQSSVNLPNVAPGVYMLRLTNGNGTRVQKVVVK